MQFLVESHYEDESPEQVCSDRCLVRVSDPILPEPPTDSIPIDVMPCHATCIALCVPMCKILGNG